MKKYKVDLTLTYFVEAKDKDGAEAVVDLARQWGFLPVVDHEWMKEDVEECNRKFREDHRYDLTNPDEFGTMLEREWGVYYKIEEV